MRIAFPHCMPDEDKTISDNGKKGSNGRVWGVAVLLAVLAGVGIWLWASRSTESSPEETSKIRSTLHLETFVLNLADTDQHSYLRVGIDLGLNREARHGEELAPVAELRDTILGVLAEAKVDELMTAGGKTRLKGNLLHALQERLPQVGVEEVYFTEFLIQR